MERYKKWLSLVLAKGIGVDTASKLLLKFETPEAILATDAKTLSAFGLKQTAIESLLNPEEEKINAILEWIDKPNHHLITIHDEDYPKLLKQIHTAPLVLYAIGQRETLGYIHFAIVGSRNPTTGGRKLAEEFAAALSSAGLTICSGLALGIDYHSHLGALNSGCSTVAVLGNGLASIYPARHKNVAKRIIENGLLISEYPPETKPKAGNFPQRNRIISGMSTGVLVVEAAKNSGSLITANYALEQGRDVFALPGSIHNPLVKGTHSLIKQGAKLVDSIDDITSELAAIVSVVTKTTNSIENQVTHANDLGAEYKRLLEAMGYEAVSVDSLVEATELTAETLSSMLLILELEGLVESQRGGLYCRC